MAQWLDRALLALMGRMTADAQERRNIFWMTVSYLFFGAGMALFSGELWNGFLKQTGFSMTQIGILGSAFGLANAIGLIAFMGLADRVRRPVRVYAITVLILTQAPLLTVAATLLLRTGFGPGVLFTVLAAITAAQALVAAVPVTLDTPVLALGASPGLRGRVLGIVTTAGGVLGIGLGWLSAELLQHLAYPSGYVWCFLAAAVAFVLRAVTFDRIRVLPALAVHHAPAEALPPLAALGRVLRLREFHVLAAPHLARGLVTGMTGLLLPVALTHLHLPAYFPGYASSAATLGAVLGGLLLSLLADRLGAGLTTLLACAIYALGLGCALLSPHPLLFLVVYVVLHTGRMVEDNSVPLGTVDLVPPAHLASVSAGRLMVLMVGIAVGAPLFGYLFDHYSVVHVALLAAVLKALTGWWLWAVFRQGRQ